MFKQITNGTVTYNRFHKRLIKAKRPLHKKTWDDEIDNVVKVAIRKQLDKLQDNKCAYCGLLLGGTSDGQVEHIAPKWKNPEFTFTRLNLVLACHFCNGFKKKGKRKIIDTSHLNYKQCTFLIVHPYFDDPNDHFEWLDDHKLLFRAKTIKGEKSEKVFKLMEEQMISHRALTRIRDTKPLDRDELELLYRVIK